MSGEVEEREAETGSGLRREEEAGSLGEREYLRREVELGESVFEERGRNPLTRPNFFYLLCAAELLICVAD